MNLKYGLAQNYIERLERFDPSSDSVQVLESARRFVRQYTGLAVADDIRSLMNRIHELLEAIVVESLKDSTLKPAFQELARKYETENVKVDEILNPKVPQIDPSRLTLVKGLQYESDLDGYATRNETTAPLREGNERAAEG